MLTESGNSVNSHWPVGPHNSQNDPVDSVPNSQTLDDAVDEKLQALSGDLTPSQLADYVREFMHVLLDYGVSNTIARDGYLEKLRSRISESKYRTPGQRDLIRQFDSEVAERHAHSGSERANDLATALIWDGDAPPPLDYAIRIPGGWSVCTAGIFKISGDELQQVISAPLFLAQRLVQETDGVESWELIWLTDDTWTKHILPREVAAQRNAIVGELSRFGLPIHSLNQDNVIAYLAAFEEANREHLPKNAVTPHLNNRAQFSCTSS